MYNRKGKEAAVLPATITIPMNLIKCPNNHLYNADHFPTCPHCANIKAGISTDKIEGHDQADINTSPVERSPEEMNNSRDHLIVGWLVCIEGTEIGNYYPLFSGINAIGRGANMDIQLASDMEISRQVHAEIFYDTEVITYYLSVRNGVNPVYVNDTLIPAGQETRVILNDRDHIHLGTHTFIFTAFCNKDFSWR